MISDISSYRLTKAKELGFIPIDAAEKDVVKKYVCLRTTSVQTLYLK